MSGFLTQEEMFELTGSKTKNGQKAVLVRNGISFNVRKDGWPVVTWNQVDNPRDQVHHESHEPDMAALLD